MLLTGTLAQQLKPFKSECVLVGVVLKQMKPQLGAKRPTNKGIHATLLNSPISQPMFRLPDIVTTSPDIAQNKA